MNDLFWLTDEQMTRLQAYFPKSHGKPGVDDRRVLSGIIFVNRNGLRWCDELKEYGRLKDALQPVEAVGRKECLRPHDGGAGCRGRHAQNDHDRRDLPESTPHGI